MKNPIDTVCAGNAKAEHINNIITHLADDYATELALKDWGETRDNFYIESSDGSGKMMCEEAYEIWDKYYDKKVDELHSFTRSILELF